MRAAVSSIVAVFLTFSAVSLADGTPAHTSRRVQGVITAVELKSLTIDCNQTKKGVTGKLDPSTRVTLNGKPAKAQDLRIAFSAKGEMGLDDGWVAVSAESR